MAEMSGGLRNGFRYAGLFLLVVVGILLLPLLAVAMRLVLMLGAVLLVVVGVLLSRFSPRFREWFETLGEEQVSYKGLRWDTHTAAHPSHGWARVRGTNAIVGVDDLVESTLGPVEVVELPPLGRQVEQGERLFRLCRGDRVVEAKAPVSGTIVATNEALLERPELVNHDPFATGWVVRIRGDRVREEGKRLLRGKEAIGWFRAETDRLLATVLPQDAIVPAMADGGSLVDHLYREIDDDTWKRLTEAFFDMSPQP